MRKVYNIEEAPSIHNNMIFHVKEDITAWLPTKQVIVDSDTHAFLYIVEEDSEYSYVRFDEKMWPYLLGMVQRGVDPVLQHADGQLELVQFAEELEGLLYNIEGNSNYGETFVTKVETAFQAFYAADEV